VTCPTAWLGARRGRAGFMNESHELARVLLDKAPDIIAGVL